MRISRPASVLRATVLAMLALALAGTGFAHAPPPPQGPALAAHLALWGGAAELCAGPAEDGGAAHRECPACQLVCAAEPPRKAAPVAAPAPVALVRLAPSGESRAVRPPRDPGLGLRAPPLA